MAKEGMNPWALEGLKNRGIIVKNNGTLEVEFFKNKFQKVKDLDAAIRQQQHIIDQQLEEQKENEEIGKLMRKFHDIVSNLTKMTVEQFEKSRFKKKNTLTKLKEILDIMVRKTEALRKDGYKRLCNVYNMVEKNNLPAANLASMAALDRMRKRWLVNGKIIDASFTRLRMLKKLK